MNGQARDKRLEEHQPIDVYPENDLVRWLRQGADAVRPHLTTIFIVVAAALVLWGYFAWRRHADRVERSAAWNDYFAEDYEAVISKHQGTEAARFARMRIAENAIIEGRSLILSKRSDALKAFEKAELQLDALISDAEAPPDLRRTALYLKAMALEASGAPEKAKEQYTKLTMQYKDSQEARVAEARIKDLSRKSAVDFYKQLANYKPGDRPGLPPPVKGSGSIDDLLRGLEGANPNLPPPVNKEGVKAPEKKDSIPAPPPAKKTPDAPPGKDLPKDDKQPAKGTPTVPPSKPVEPPKKVIADFIRRKDFFVGIDSDGCAFDTMEVKHKECFIPNIVGCYGLAAVSKYAREAAEFVNLYSQWRGINRFPGLIMALDLLRQRSEVAGRGFEVPHLPKTREWMAKETKLGNPALAKAVQETNDPELALLLEWSKAVNESVERIVKRVPPFPFVAESLDKLASQADLIVCSATPGEALTREWQEHGIDRCIGRICGQEVGSKKEILAVTNDYPKSQALMIGDAPGDLAAARANQVLFFPIIPGSEEASWKRFHDEGIQKFLDRSFAGDYEDALVAEFEASLPSTPPWQT